MKPIGSSRVGATMGFSMFHTGADIARELREEDGHGGAPRSMKAAMHGTILEPGLREHHARLLGVEVVAGPSYEAPAWKVAEHQHSHWDGYARMGGGLLLTEYKATSSWDGWGDAAPRVDYLTQVLHAMEAQPEGDVSGLTVIGAEVLAYNWETGEIRRYTVERTGRGRKLVDRTGEWYRRHVIDAEPVPPQPLADYAALTKTAPVYRQPSTGDEDLARALRDARLSVKMAQAEEERAKAALQALLGDCDGIEGLVTNHQQATRRLVPDRVRELQDERPDLTPLLARCWDTTTNRVIRLTKEKKE